MDDTRSHDTIESEQDQVSEGSNVEDTKHEPHEHAGKRVRIGIIALVVVAALVIVLVNWGEEIKEYCFGEDGACPVEIDPALLDEDADLQISPEGHDQPVEGEAAPVPVT